MTTKPLLRLRVLAEDGRPHAGAFVTVGIAPEPFPELALVADAQGVVTLHLTPGRYRFQARGHDGTMATTDLDMPDTNRECVMTLTPS